MTTQFTVEAGIRIPDREKRDAERELNKSIGDVTIPVEATQQGTGDRSSAASLAGGAGALDALDDQTGILADIHDELRKIGTTGGGGGGGLLGGTSGFTAGSIAAGGGGLLATVLSKGKGGLARGLKGASKGLGRRIPMLNTAIYGAEMLGEDTNKGRANALGGFLGSTAGALGGAKAGAAAGGALGSVVPGAGTAVGAGAGAIVGGIAGGIGGDQIGRKAADTLTSELAGIDLSPPDNLFPSISAPGDEIWPDISEPNNLWPDLEPPDGFWPSERPGGSDGVVDELLSILNLNPDGEPVPEGTRDPSGKASVSPGHRPGPTSFETPSGKEVTVGAPNSTGSAGLPSYITNDAQAQDLAMMFQNNLSGPGSGNSPDLSKSQEARVDVVIQEVAARVDSGRALEDALRTELKNVSSDIKEEILREIRSDIKNHP